MITLNVSGVNALIKRHMVTDWIKKKNKNLQYVAYKILTSGGKTHTQIESDGMENIFHSNVNDNKSEVSIFISD